MCRKHDLMESYSVNFCFGKLSRAEMRQKQEEGNYCGKSNTTSTGDVKCITVILVCVSLDKTRT